MHYNMSLYKGGLLLSLHVGEATIILELTAAEAEHLAEQISQMNEVVRAQHAEDEMQAAALAYTAHDFPVGEGATYVHT